MLVVRLSGCLSSTVWLLEVAACLELELAELLSCMWIDQISVKRRKVCNLNVEVSAGRYSRVEDCEVWDEEMKAARKVETSAEEVERLLGLMCEKALKKYTDLVKLHGKDVKAERNAAVEENICSVPSKGTKMARKHRKRRGRKVDVSSVPGAEAAGRTPFQDEAVA